jgi:hypothetical protein
MPSPFEQLLGAQFHRLPTSVQRLHALRAAMTTAGRAEVKAASNLFARLLCWGAGLPRPGAMDVSVCFKPRLDGSEHWDRHFGDRRYASSIRAGAGKDRDFLIEHFGPFDLRFRLTARDDGLAWSLTGWRLLRIRLPGCPRIECLEGADGERFTFDIDVTFPLIGWLIHYRGWLLPVDDVSRSPVDRSA